MCAHTCAMFAHILNMSPKKKYVWTHILFSTHIFFWTHIQYIRVLCVRTHTAASTEQVHMGWLRLVGSSKL